jgi:phosphomannomutase
MADFYTSFSNTLESFVLNSDLINQYSLKTWAQSFKLGTAGYRDLLDTEDFFSTEVPFNGISMAILAMARSNISKQHGIKSLHIGGEVRPHTSKLIDLFSRIYSFQGFSVHLRDKNVKTTPIWLSSFGVFHYSIDGGENFTASHSQNYKGGWKPMDNNGMQLLDMAAEIADEVRAIIKAAENSPLTVYLAPADSKLIFHDFHPSIPYVESLKTIFSSTTLKSIKTSLNNGLKIAISTEGGSMGSAARAIFKELDFPMDSQGISLLHEEESSTFHNIGIVDGVNHGVDPGKWQVYKNIGAQELLKTREADIVFIWDPDGDRFNIVTTAPSKIQTRVKSVGLETEQLDKDRILVYFKPNQIYFLLTALRIAELADTGLLNKFDWSIAITWPTSRSIQEIGESIASSHGQKINKVLVPVGFKHFGNLVKTVETDLKLGKQPIEFKDVTGKNIILGNNPRFVIMAEESGGAAMGTSQALFNKDKSASFLAMKEKDGMQIAIATMALASKLFKEKGSFAGEYLSLIEKYPINSLIYERRDVILYDESLKGEERIKEKAKAELLKNSIVNYYRNLTTLPIEKATIKLRKDLNDPDFKAPLSIIWAGDGTFIEFDNSWFEVRASGTDAVLRFYFEGPTQEIVSKINGQLSTLRP